MIAGAERTVSQILNAICLELTSFCQRHMRMMTFRPCAWRHSSPLHPLQFPPHANITIVKQDAEPGLRMTPASAPQWNQISALSRSISRGLNDVFCTTLAGKHVHNT